MYYSKIGEQFDALKLDSISIAQYLETTMTRLLASSEFFASRCIAGFSSWCVVAVEAW